MSQIQLVLVLLFPFPKSGDITLPSNFWVTLPFLSSSDVLFDLPRNSDNFDHKVFLSLPLNLHNYLSNSEFYHNLEKILLATFKVIYLPFVHIWAMTDPFCCLLTFCSNSLFPFISWPSLNPLPTLLFLHDIWLRKHLAPLSSYLYFLLWYSSSFCICWNCHSSIFMSNIASVNYFWIPQVEFKFLSSMIL